MIETLFFIASKTIGLMVRVEFWLMLLLVIGLWRRWAVAAALGAMMALAVLPVGTPLMGWLEGHYPAQPLVPVPVDGIIVLGGAEDFGVFAQTGLPGMNDAGERLTEGAVLARRFPGARLIFTGGTADLIGTEDHTLPSRMVRALWLSLGVPEAQIVLEDRSRNTSENARLTLALIDPQPGQTWILVTSAWHMPRSVETFERAGWQGLIPWPVDYRADPFEPGLRRPLSEHLGDLNSALREVVGLVVYRLTGR